MAEVGIYSGKWFFDAYLPGVTEFSYLPLWASQYDGVPDAGVLDLFGGWGPAQVALKQYAGTSTLCGVGNVDLDVLSGSEAARLAPPPPDYVTAIAYMGDTLADKLYKVSCGKQVRAVADEMRRVRVQFIGPRPVA